MQRTSRNALPDHAAFRSRRRAVLYQGGGDSLQGRLSGPAAVAVALLSPAETADSGRRGALVVGRRRCGGRRRDVHSADAVFRFGARSLHVLLLAAGATCAPAFCLAGRDGPAAVSVRLHRSPRRRSGRTRASPSTDSSSRACCTARFSTAERMPHGSALRPCCLSFPTP